MSRKEELQAYHAAWYQKNKVRLVQEQAEYRENNKRHVMGIKLKQKYDMTLQTWEGILIEQAGLCAACGRPMMGWKDPAVDHDHLTMKIRGLVHDNCNRAIGLMGDDPKALADSAKYLQKHKEK